MRHRRDATTRALDLIAFDGDDTLWHDERSYIEVVSQKTPDVYTRILARHGVAPDRFLMIGNSLRSDVLPVVEARGWAVHIPAALSWSHEHADVPPRAKGRYFEVAALDRLPDVIEALARSAR